MSQITLPEEWTGWKLVEEIGEGSYGTVYKAEKVNGEITAVSAVKVVSVPSEKSELKDLLREFQSEESVREYLKDLVNHCADEIRTMYLLQGDSNIVSIQDHLIKEDDDGLHWKIYIRMEYLQSFSDYAVTHEFEEEEIVQIGIALCNALEKCEKYQILHRDIKPDNLFVTESGAYKLGDFGISRHFERTYANYSAKGTFNYMAPEVFRGEAYGSNADVYSLGLILYKLSNRNCEPFIDPNKQMVYYKDREQALARRMSGEKLSLPCEVSRSLGNIILRACEYDAADRYPSAAAMRQDLLEFQKGKRIKPAIVRSTSGKRFPRWILAVSGGIAVAGLILFAFFQHFGKNREAVPTSFVVDTPVAAALSNENLSAFQQLAVDVCAGKTDCFEDMSASAKEFYLNQFADFQEYAGTNAIVVASTGETCLINYVCYKFHSEDTSDRAYKFLYLKKQGDGWKVTADAECITSLDDFIHQEAYRNGEIYPELISEAFREDRCLVDYDPENYSFLNPSAAYAGDVIGETRFLTEDEEGRIWIMLQISNGKRTATGSAAAVNVQKIIAGVSGEDGTIVTTEAEVDLDLRADSNKLVSIYLCKNTEYPDMVWKTTNVVPVDIEYCMTE